jgi:hypothetical protein
MKTNVGVRRVIAVIMAILTVLFQILAIALALGPGLTGAWTIAAFVVAFYLSIFCGAVFINMLSATGVKSLKRAIYVVRQNSEEEWRQPETKWLAEYLRIVVVYDDGTSDVVFVGDRFNPEHWQVKMNNKGEEED